MQHLHPKKLIEISLALMLMAFSAPSLAEGCSNPFSPEDNTFVTQYGGADLTCPTTGSNSTYEECEFTFKNGVVDSMTIGCANLGISIVEVSDTDGVVWESSAGDPMSGIPASSKVDAILTDSAQGGKGCLYSFGIDQDSGAVGFQRSSGLFFPPTRAVFCSDNLEEVTAVVEEPAVVEECVIPFGESKEIHGVTFSCPTVGPGELRTIIVVKNTECDPSTGADCNFVPGFGFLGDDQTLDFNNVCQCQGAAIPGVPTGADFGIVSEECEPDPNADGGTGGCEVIGGAEVPVDASIQNPTCFTVGGRRKCF